MQPVPVVLHIGTEKTGSTAIQAYLRENQRALREAHGTLIPAALGGAAATHLAAACQRRETPDALRSARGLDTLEAVLAYSNTLAGQLREELASAQPDQLLLSCENFTSRLQTREEVEALRDFLQPFAASVKVVVYLRDQVDMITSSYTTKVRNGFTGQFRFPPQGAERSDAHYDALLELWSVVFGAANMDVRLYDKNRLEDADIVTDFCQATGIPADLPRSDPRPNRSPDVHILELLRRLNEEIPHRIDGGPNPLRGDLADAVFALNADNTGDALRAADTSLGERFDAGNRAVAAKWFAQDPSVPPTLFDRAQPRTAVDASPELTGELLLRATARLWQHQQAQLHITVLERDQLKAELFMARGETERALKLCQRLCKKNPGDALCLSLLERAEQLAGQ